LNAIALIPARGGSRRLPGKNVYPVQGKPLLGWAIEAAQASKYITACYVTTEDPAIASVARSFGANVIDRPVPLARDEVWTQTVLQHALVQLAEQGIQPDIVVRLYAHPRLEPHDIDRAIELLQRRKLWEVFSVDREGVENGAIHVYRREVIFQEALSVYEGIITTDYTDFHTKEELQAQLSVKRR
jgi:N-acylneuraminate cytidylyltransferase